VRVCVLVCVCVCMYTCMYVRNVLSVYYFKRYHDAMLRLMASGVEFDKMDGAALGAALSLCVCIIHI